MTEKEAIKISLCYHTAVKAIEILTETFDGLDWDDMTDEGHSDAVYVWHHLKTVTSHLGIISAEIREMETLFDAQDEQEIDDLVCAIEDALNGKRGYMRTIPSQPALDAIADKLPPEGEMRKGKISMVDYAEKIVMGNIPLPEGEK